MIDQSNILEEVSHYEKEVDLKYSHLEKLYSDYNEVVRKLQNAAVEWEMWALKFEKTDRNVKGPDYWALVRTFSETERLFEVADSNEKALRITVGKAKKDYHDTARMLELVVNLHSATLTYDSARKRHSYLRLRMKDCKTRFEKMIPQKDLLVEHIDDLCEETSVSQKAEESALSKLILAEDQLEAYKLVYKREVSKTDS
jgi:hypothetical protein